MAHEYQDNNPQVTTVALKRQINADPGVVPAVCHYVSWTPPDFVTVGMDRQLDDVQEAAMRLVIRNHVGGALPGPNDPSYQVDLYDVQVLASTTWYAVKISDGVYDGKVREILYRYNDNRSVLLSTVENQYALAGNLTDSKTTNYLNDIGPTSRIIKENA